MGLQRSATRFADVAVTANQRNLATAIERLPADNPVYQSLLIAPSAELARQAYRQLSGQIHADIASALVNNSRYVRDTLNGRLRQTQGAADSSDIKQDEDGAWVSLLGNWEHASGNDNATGFHDSTLGYCSVRIMNWPIVGVWAWPPVIPAPHCTETALLPTVITIIWLSMPAKLMTT